MLVWAVTTGVIYYVYMHVTQRQSFSTYILQLEVPEHELQVNCYVRMFLDFNIEIRLWVDK